MPMCRFFLAGRCKFGSSCHNSHDTPASTASDNTASQDSSVADMASSSAPQSAGGSSVANARKIEAAEVSQPSNPVTCKYFASGNCRYGASCRFDHDTNQGDSANMEFKGKTQTQMDDGPLSSTKDTSYTVDLKSARVTFKDGFEITEVRLYDDYSSVEISDLPDIEDLEETVHLILKTVNIDVPRSAVSIKRGSQSCRATIKFKDPGSAKLAARDLYELYSHNFGAFRGEVSTSNAYTSSKYSAYLDLCSVSCVWYRPSRRAIVVLDSMKQARNVMQHIQNSPAVLGRAIIVEGPVGSERRPVLKLSGLRPETKEDDLQKLLSPITTTAIITMKEPTCFLDDGKSADGVMGLLLESGGLQSFGSLHLASDKRHLKATAVFIDPISAVTAIQALHEKRFEVLGNVMLMLSRSLHISYHVRTGIFKAVKPELEKLRLEAKDTSMAGITLHVCEEKPLSILRCRAESEDFIVRLKARVEKILEGEVLLDGEMVLWHTWFASTRGTTCINKIATHSQVYVYRDRHISQLRVYGDTSTSKIVIVKRILKELEAAITRIHCITLDEDMLVHVKNGGLERLREEFRSAVDLNHTAGQTALPAIILYGTTADAQLARSMIVDNAPPTPEETAECPVCLGPVMDPVKLSCGHAYCRDCFYNASTAAVNDLPFECIGKDGQCRHICGIKEVLEILPYSRSEKLFEDILTSYIRRYRDKFRCCPTPDCTSLYRPSTDGLLFTCLRCLTSICTTCHAVEHKGITCEDYRRYHADGGARALAQYKADNDVRDCPNCEVPIEKDDGCMHVECRCCNVHICWICMDWFNRGHNGGHHECYTHMVTTHGGIYDDNPVYDPDDDFSDDEGEADEDRRFIAGGWGDDHSDDELELEIEVPESPATVAEGESRSEDEGEARLEMPDRAALERILTRGESDTEDERGAQGLGLRERHGQGAGENNANTAAPRSTWDGISGDENANRPEDQSDEGEPEDETAWNEGDANVAEVI